MSENTKGISSSTGTTKSRWRYRVAFTANVYLDIETGSAETPDEELERLAIEAFRAGSKESRDLPLDEAGIDLPALPADTSTRNQTSTAVSKASASKTATSRRPTE